MAPQSARSEWPPQPPSNTVIPPPQGADSAHYKFLGRPVGALDQLLGTPAHPPPPVVVWN
ncbi:hypothetical protein B0H10DRAFT_2054702, partial [Mycena sp. CBHHK59/15]